MIDIFDKRNYIIEEGEDEDINPVTSNTGDDALSDDEVDDLFDNKGGSDEPPEDNPEDGALSDDEVDDLFDGQDDNQTQTNDEGESEEDTDTEEEPGEEPDGEEDIEDEEEPQEEKSLFELEQELYASLEPHQKQNRNEELKDSFVRLYTFIQALLDRIITVKKSNVNIKILEFGENKLRELHSLTYDYIMNSYNNNTYIQNNIRYKQNLIIIKKVLNLLENIEQKD